MRTSRGFALWKLVLAAIAVSAPLIASAQLLQKDWTKTVRRDRETRLYTFSVFQNSGTFCTDYGIPGLTVTSPPQNGTARIAQTEATPKGCPNAIKANGVFYQPNPGFTGSDVFTVEATPQGRVEADSSAKTNIFHVTVK